jgi:hypothetical protein
MRERFKPANAIIIERINKNVCEYGSAKKNQPAVNEMLCGRCHRFASTAIMNATTTANKIECVKPRWANKPDGVSSHVAAIKSISGMLCAIMPHTIAFLPNVLPAKASPIHAPRAI